MKKILAASLIMCCMLFTSCNQSARSIGIIGGADGPTEIIVANKNGDTVKKPLRMFKAEGKLYYDTGLISEVTARCGTLDGEFNQVGLTYEIPKNDNECNFEGSEGYQNVTSITKEVPIDGKWVIFKLYDDTKNVAKYDMDDLKYCFYLKGHITNTKEAEIIMLTDDVNCSFDDYMNFFSGSYKPDGNDYKYTFQSYRSKDKWGLSLGSKDVTNKGLTILFEQFGGAVTGELQTGEAFSLEVNKNDKWEPVATNPLIDYAWHAIAYKINKNDITELEVDWEWLYGELPRGYYKMKKEITDFRAAGDFDKEAYELHFWID